MASLKAFSNLLMSGQQLHHLLSVNCLRLAWICYSYPYPTVPAFLTAKPFGRACGRGYDTCRCRCFSWRRFPEGKRKRGRSGRGPGWPVPIPRRRVPLSLRRLGIDASTLRFSTMTQLTRVGRLVMGLTGVRDVKKLFTLSNIIWRSTKSNHFCRL